MRGSNIGFLLAGFLLFCLNSQGGAKGKKHIPLDVAVTHNNQGVQYLIKQDLEKALWEFKTAAEIDPQYAEARSNLGLIHKYQGDYPQAIECFHQAIKIDPKWATPYNHLGTVYIALQDYSRALDNIRKAIAKDHKFADAYYNMGVAYLHRSEQAKDPKEDWKRAVQTLQKATELDAHLYNAHLELANTYRRLGDWEKAIIRYRVAIETNPGDPEPWKGLCSLYQEKGDEARAAECLVMSRQKQSSAQPVDAKSLVALGEGYLKEKRYGEALQVFGQVVKQDPQNAIAYFDIGFTHYAQGHYTEALSAYQQAIHIQPNYLAAHYNEAVTYVALQNLPKAIASLETTLQVNPQHPQGLFDLGRLYYQTGRNPEAATSLCRFKKIAPPDMPEEKALADKLLSQIGGC